MSLPFELDRTSAQAAQLERLVWRLRAHREAGCQVVLLCSCWPDEGKSTVALHLAQLASNAGSRVLLVDGDTRRPALSHCFSSRGQGFTEFLEDADFKHVNPGPAGVDLLGSGISRELYISPQGAEVARFRKKVADYDLVLLDSPPLSACSDAMVLAELCDRAVLVVSGRAYQGRPEVRFVKELRSLALPIEGVIVTQARPSGSTRLADSWWARLLVWVGLRA